jgi:hypothetical protein
METTCTRCHQAIPADGLYCPACGLPQLVYAGEDALAPAQVGAWTDVIREAGAVDWKQALRVVLLLAVPAGLLSSELSPVGIFGLIWIAIAAAWAVSLYARRQRSLQQSFGITTGMGARIGLATGVIAGWCTFAASSASFFVTRFLLHQGKDFDDLWKSRVADMSQQWQAMSATSQDQQAAALFKSLAAWFLSPEGKAASTLGGLVMLETLLLIVAVVGGIIGARMLAGPRRQQQG